MAQRGSKCDASVEVEGGNVTAARVVVVGVLTHDFGEDMEIRDGFEKFCWPKRVLYTIN